jgi:hypothetical protein
MLGALHRALHDKSWYSAWYSAWYSTEDDAVEDCWLSARDLVDGMEVVRSETVVKSRMARLKGGHNHRDCTPWPRFTLFDVLKSLKLEDLFYIDENDFRKRQTESGVRLSIGSLTAATLPARFFSFAAVYGSGY